MRKDPACPVRLFNRRRDPFQLFEVPGGREGGKAHGVRVLAGVQIDYVNSVMGQGLTVRNPNAVSTCGCGHSFKTADDAGAPDPCGDDGRGCS